MRDHDYTIYNLARLGVSAYHVEQILRDLPAIQRGHEADCSWPEEVSSPFTKRGDSAMKRVRAILTSYQTIGRVEEQGDPRGAPVVVIPAGESGEQGIRLGAAGFTASQVERIDAAADRSR